MPLRRSVLFLLAIAIIVPALAREPDAPEYQDHTKVLYYLDAQGQPQPIADATHFETRRRHIVAGLERLMGPLPDRKNLPPLDVQVQESVVGEGWVRHKLTYVAEPDSRVPAYLFLPEKRQGKTAAMICLTQTTNNGKDEVAGLKGLPNLHIGLELAQRGYVVLCPDYPSLGEYQYDFNADEHPSGTLKGVINHMRGVDLLAAREEVDPLRIGTIGHSLGGHNSIFLGVCDRRLKVIVSSCGWTPFGDYYGGDIRGWSGERYFPRLVEKYELKVDRVPFDFYELVSALAPRGFFSNSPVGDGNFDVAGVRKAIPVAAEVYKLFDAADKLQVRYPDCEHDFPPETRQEAYEFIDRLLQHKPLKAVP
ncbi:MAG: alpha/beta hydrolase family protein [Pirellulales bacterium]